MYVTGRLAALIGLGVVPVILLSLAAGGSDGGGSTGTGIPSGTVAWLAVAGWLLLCTIAAIADASAAADPRAIRIERETPARARLGVPVRATITVAVTGRRRLRAPRCPQRHRG